jgi:hypothetical protein
MTRLIPDWRHGYKKALRDLGLIPPAVEEEEEDRVYSQPDLTGATLWSETDDGAEATRKAEIEAQEDLADGGPYVGCDEVPYAPAEIKVDIPAPTVEESVAPPPYAPLTELIKWHIQHGVRDLLALAEICGRDYPTMWRVATEMKKQNIIHTVNGGWEMVA